MVSAHPAYRFGRGVHGSAILCLPGAPGHEGWGIVNAVGPGVSSVSNGARVAFLSTNAFAQYDIAWEAEVVTLPAQLSSQPFPGEAIGCAMNIFRRADIRSCHTTAIVGIGFLGALLTQLASRAGSRVIAISRSASALNVANESGAAIAFALDDDPVRQVMRVTEGKGCERVIEAVGTPKELGSRVGSYRRRWQIDYRRLSPRW